MLTKNFYKAFTAYLWGIRDDTTNMLVNHRGQTVTTNGYMYNMWYLNTPNANPSYIKVKKGVADDGVVFGDGNTPASIDDYQMSGEHFTTYSALHSRNYNIDETGVTATIVFTITNTGTETFTIREIGQFYQQGSSTDLCVLVERTVLDSPVTIEPNGIGQVTYTVRFPFPA